MNKIKSNWIRRRWTEERFGTSNYFMYALTISNFILIIYRFLFEEEQILSGIISELWVFSLVLIIGYIPISILIGYWHRRTQLSTENLIKRLEDPLLAHVFRIILDTRLGKKDGKEIEKLKGLFDEIEDKKSK